MKGLESAEDVAIARIIAAGIALHALVASPIRIETKWTNEKLVDEAFAIADLFIQRAEKEAP